MHQYTVGDRVLCIKSPPDTSMIKKGEIYETVEVCERVTTSRLNAVRIIDRRGNQDCSVRFNADKWFIPAPMITNEERIKRRREEITTKGD